MLRHTAPRSRPSISAYHFMTPGDLKKEGARIWCDRINGQSDPDRVNVNEGGEVQPGVVFEVDLPPALSFVEPMIAGAIRDKGQKLLTP